MLKRQPHPTEKGSLGSACKGSHCVLDDHAPVPLCQPALEELSGPLESQAWKQHTPHETKHYSSRWVALQYSGRCPREPRRRESPQRNPVASLIKMREQFKPSEAASNPGELSQAAAGFTPPSLPFFPPSLSTSPVVLSSLPGPALTSKAELSYRITWGFYK